MRLRSVALTCVLFTLSGCGGGGLPPSSSVVVTISPAQATVKTGGAVTLRASATGFTASPIVSWWIQESKNRDFNNDCGKLDTQTKDFTGCPYGFVMFHDGTTVPSTATYYAPPQAGTYHVTVQMTEVCCWFDYLSKTAEAAITVSE